VTHADPRLRHDVERVRAQEIVVLVHRPGERVLDGNRSPCGVARLDGSEQLLEAGARHQSDVGPERLERRRVAE